MTIRSLIEATADSLTPSERKLASTLLADYPYAGLSTIQELAERADISAPSITRFTTKIGLPGYPEMQRKLLEELRNREGSPVELEDGFKRIEGNYLRGFLERASDKIQSAANAITQAQFERICKLISDPKRKLFSLGGRSSDTIAHHLMFHLRQVRSDVVHMPRDTELWPDHLLRMDAGDVLFLVDFRRYERALTELARVAASQKVQVIVMTDKWQSPAKKHAAELLVVPIETRTAWDSYTAGFAIAEALATRIAEENWEQTRSRIEAWDTLRLPTLGQKDD